MKYLVLLILSLLLFSCKKEKVVIREGFPYVKSVSKSIYKRDFPIKNVSTIEFLSYPDRIMWDTIGKGQDLEYKDLILNSKLNFDSTMIKERIVLNENQKNKLYALMICDTCVPEESQAACYMPRHMILFMDKSNKIIAYNEFCFSCNGSRYSKNLNNFQKFCIDDMYDLFKKSGIKYFADTLNQVREENKFIDSIQKARGIIK